MDTTGELEYERSDTSTEEERKKREDYRRTREKISRAMGQYLLKGYKMLSTTCEACGNILLQARDGVNYCVQCSEFCEVRSNGATKVESGVQDASMGQVSIHNDQKPNVSTVSPHTASCVPGTVQESLLQKLQWASSELKVTTSVECSIALCQLIKACSEALQSVQIANVSVNSLS